MVKETNLLPFNLQYFAEGKEEDEEGKNGENPEGKENENDKKFSQEAITAMMTKEKNEGRKAILNALGVEKVEDAQKAMEFFKKFNEAFSGDKSPEEIQKALETDKSKAEQRAQAAENKLACMLAGVSKDSIDDVLAIASPKVTDDKDLLKVVEEMKNQVKYSNFFTDEEGSKGSGKDTGTGSDVGHGKESSGSNSLAKRLAEGSKSSQKKSSYFN